MVASLATEQGAPATVVGVKLLEPDTAGPVTIQVETGGPNLKTCSRMGGRQGHSLPGVAQRCDHSTTHQGCRVIAGTVDHGGAACVVLKLIMCHQVGRRVIAPNAIPIRCKEGSNNSPDRLPLRERRSWEKDVIGRLLEVLNRDCKRLGVPGGKLDR